MDALALTHTPHGWLAAALGPWQADLGAHGGAGFVAAAACVPAGQVLALLARLVPAHVVITIEGV